jgi:hypothetical protein
MTFPNTLYHSLKHPVITNGLISQSGTVPKTLSSSNQAAVKRDGFTMQSITAGLGLTAIFLSSQYQHKLRSNANG